MTDKEKLEKVRAEIERRKKLHEDSLINPIHIGFGLQNVTKAKISELTYLHSFIDSMQKEPKKCMYSKDNYTDEDRKVLCAGCEEECKFNKQEELVSKDLEEASYRFACKCHPLKTEYSTSSPNPEVIDAFKAGANWKEQQLMAVEIAREETIDKVVEWLKKNVTYTHPRKGTKECIVNIAKLKNDLNDE